MERLLCVLRLLGCGAQLVTLPVVEALSQARKAAAAPAALAGSAAGEGLVLFTEGRACLGPPSCEQVDRAAYSEHCLLGCLATLD